MFGLNVGRIAIARISPVRGSMARTIPALAPVVRHAASSSRSARYWTVASRVRTSPLPGVGVLRMVGCPVTSRPSASRSTSASPASPARVLSWASSTPRAPVVPATNRARGRPARGSGRTERLGHRADPRQPRARMASAAGGGIFTFTQTNGRSLARRCSMSRARSPRCGPGRRHRRAGRRSRRKRVHGLDRRAHGQGVAVAVEDRPALGPERMVFEYWRSASRASSS